MNGDPSEVHSLAKQNPELVAELVRSYADYEKQNGVVAGPGGDNPLEQVVKNSKRGVRTSLRPRSTHPSSESLGHGGVSRLRRK